MKETVLSIKGLHTHFDADKGVIRAVDNISFDIRRGELFALLGESGCGKSVTALSLLRLVPHPGRIVSGEIWLNGVDLCRLPEEKMRSVRGRKMAMIFQEPMTALNPVMTIGAQISETMEYHFGKTRKEAHARTLELLDQVGVPDPEHRYKAYPHQMSGGMKQRVMIAMALAGDPEILIADEPTTALDVTIQAQVLDLLRRLQKARGMAILLITHDLGVVSEVADRVAVMYAGHIVEMADRTPFFENPLHPYSKKLFDSIPYKAKRGSELAMIRGAVPPLSQPFVGCRFANRCDWAWELCERPDRAPELMPAVSPSPPKGHDKGGMTDRVVRCYLYDPTVSGGRAAAATGSLGSSTTMGQGRLQMPSEERLHPLLRVSDLTVHFPVYRGLFRRLSGLVRAVDGVSFDIHAGKTLALVGESGCGKTTTGKAILQLISPTNGRVFFRGVDLASISSTVLRTMRKEFQIVFQDPYASLNPRMMIGETLREGLTVIQVGKVEAKKRMDQLLEQVGLQPDAKARYPHEFSGGQRQRISIARALSVNPRLIICDEPTSALDVSVQAQILNLLKKLQEQLGLSYLFITHNLSIVEYFADEVAVMYLGRIVESGKVEEVLGSPQHPYTQALLSAVPQIDPKTKRQFFSLPGDIPSPISPPTGCHFHPRCPHAMPVCKEVYPRVTEKGATHRVLCHLYEPTSVLTSNGSNPSHDSRRL